MHAKCIQALGTQFVSDGECHALALRSVAQGRT
jgi:hypothetical protein